MGRKQKIKISSEYLKDNKTNNSKIAELLDKSSSNVWTLNARATKKLRN